MADIRVSLVADAIYVPGLIAGLPTTLDGAVATFIGVVRDNQEGKPVSHLEYEAHAPMAEKRLEQLGRVASERWSLSTVTLEHRLGRLEVGDISVFVGAAAPHRAEALAACAWLIDTLKAEVPIFKREFFLDGTSDWVEEGLPAG